MVVFIMAHVQVFVGRVDLIVNVVWQTMNTWKTCQQESLFRPKQKWKQPANDKETFGNDSLLYKALNQGALVNSELLD